MTLTNGQFIGAVFVLIWAGSCGLVISLWLRAKQRKVLRAVSWSGIVLAIVAFLGSMSAMLWDGRFSQSEFRLTFQDQDGKPIPGVELGVENESGSKSFHYPVTDYLPGQIPTSDSNGVLVFHHVRQGLEFGGTCSDLFGVIRVGTCDGPPYICRFSLNDHEVYRIRYNDLAHHDNRIGTVTRRWQWSTWPHDQFELGNASNVFPLDGNSQQGADGSVAYLANQKAYRHMQDIKQGRAPAEEELEFYVIEKTISVNLSRPLTPVEFWTFLAAMIGYAGLAAVVLLTTWERLPFWFWRPTAALIVLHVAMVWAVRYEWQPAVATRNGYAGFVIFHSAGNPPWRRATAMRDS